MIEPINLKKLSKWIHLPQLSVWNFNKTYLSCHHLDNSWDPNSPRSLEIPWIQAKALGCNPFKEISSNALMALFGINTSTPGPGPGLVSTTWRDFGFVFVGVSSLFLFRLFFEENYGEMIFRDYIVMNRSLRTRMNLYNKKNRKSQTNKSTVGYEKTCGRQTDQLVTLPGSTSRVPPTSCKRRCAANAAIFLSWCTRSMVSEDKKNINLPELWRKKREHKDFVSSTLSFLLEGWGRVPKTCGHCLKSGGASSKKKLKITRKKAIQQAASSRQFSRPENSMWKIPWKSPLKDEHTQWRVRRLVFFLTILQKKCAPGISKQRIPTTQARVFY